MQEEKEKEKRKRERRLVKSVFGREVDQIVNSNNVIKNQMRVWQQNKGITNTPLY